MAKEKLPKFVPDMCECCGQSRNYDIKLCKGAVLIVIALLNAVKIKKENAVHLNKEMVVSVGDFPSYREMISAGKMTHRMMDNILMARYHGLVASVNDRSGFYCITTKGADFLRGKQVPRVAIVDKKTHTNAGYFNMDKDQTTAQLLLKSDPFWGKYLTLLTHHHSNRCCKYMKSSISREIVKGKIADYAIACAELEALKMEDLSVILMEIAEIITQ